MIEMRRDDGPECRVFSSAVYNSNSVLAGNMVAWGMRCKRSGGLKERAEDQIRRDHGRFGVVEGYLVWVFAKSIQTYHDAEEMEKARSQEHRKFAPHSVY